MRSLSNALGKGNLTPRERFILLIQNDIHRIKTGTEILTGADKAALEHWRARTNEEAQEWNRLNEGWKYTGRLEIETQFYFDEARIEHLRVKPLILDLVLYPYRREMGRMIQNISDIKKVTAAEAMVTIEKQRAAKLRNGLDFEYAVYQLAFEHLSAEDRERFIELYPDIETDHQYLDEEEIIAHLLAGKDVLGAEAKKKLADLIAEKSYNTFAEQYQLYHYFACIPLAEVARHFLKSKGVRIDGKPLAQNQEADDEDDRTHVQIQKAIERYAKEHTTTVEAILKEGFIHWYDTEEFVYTPLIVSDDKELFARWLKTRAAARAELQKLIRTGGLSVRARTADESRRDKLYSKGLHDSELIVAQKAIELLDISIEEGELDEKKAFESFSEKVITGESLYRFSGNFEFVKAFRERVDEYDPNLGIVYADDDPDQEGEHMDRELLISSLNANGETSIFSLFGISLSRLRALFEVATVFEEKQKKGKATLRFKSAEIEKIFREARESFITSYGKLLAMKELLHKISAIYETDLTFRVQELLGILDENIDEHNSALKAAQRPMQWKKLEGGDEESENPKELVQVNPNLFIDISGIVPDADVISEHTSKLKEIFWAF